MLNKGADKVGFILKCVLFLIVATGPNGYDADTWLIVDIFKAIF